MILVGLTFLFAGMVKGIIGLGLPTVTIAVMTLTIGIKEGIALIVIPTIMTNIWQAFVGGDFHSLGRRFWSFILVGCLCTWIATGILVRANALVLAAGLGVLLVVYSAINLSHRQFQIPRQHESWLSPVMGGASGLLMGLTGSFIVPGILYLQSAGLNRHQLVQVMGMTFGAVAIVLGVGLARYQLITPEIAVTSVAALIPASLGMIAGQRIRSNLSEERFRLVFFLALSGVGLYLTVKTLILI